MINLFEEYKHDKYVKRNFLLNTFDGAIYSFGASFVATSTVIPVFVKSIGGSNITVGLLPFIWTFGFNFPQIFIAPYIRNKAYKKPVLIVTALLQRIPFLLLALFTFFFIEKSDSAIQLAVFLFFFALAPFFGSINLPGWFDLIAKVTPVKLRGRLFAFRSIIGGILGIISGYIVKIVLESVAFPSNFALLFLLAFITTMTSYTLLFFIKEKEPNAAADKLKYIDFIKRIPSIIQGNKNYRNYLIADALLLSSLMADTFFAVNGIEKFNLASSYAGSFTIVIMVSMILGNLIFGNISDSYGHKINLQMASASVFVACLVAYLSASITAYYFVFVFSAFTTTLIMNSRLTIIAELCSENDRPAYIAITNMITAPFILTGVLGGYVANNYGYNYVFIIASVLAISASLWLMLKVKEPRNISLETT